MTRLKHQRELRGLHAAGAFRSETAYTAACDTLWYFRLFYMRVLQRSPNNVFARTHCKHVIHLLSLLHTMAPDACLCAEQAAYMSARIQRLPTYGNEKAQALAIAHAKAYAPQAD